MRWTIELARNIEKSFMAAVFGSAISFVLGFVLRLPMQNVIISAGLTGILVFSGFIMRAAGSKGNTEEKQKEQSNNRSN